jgi:hypothetical protein
MRFNAAPIRVAPIVQRRKTHFARCLNMDAEMRGTVMSITQPNGPLFVRGVNRSQANSEIQN